MTPTWKFVKLATIYVADPGWHHDDDATITKLANSLQRHGQMQALVVRGDIEDDTMCTLVGGHKVLGAMLSLGWTEAMAVHLGSLDAVAAVRAALALEIDFETDYSRMVQAVTPLLEQGIPATELAAGSPFDAERLKHFPKLATLDWGTFGADTTQRTLDWDSLETQPEPPMLVLDTATGVVTQASERVAAQVATIGPPMVPVEEPLEDITEAAAQEAQPAAPPAAPPETAEPAAAPLGEPETKPGKAAKAKAAKAPKAEKPPVPKPENAQLGLF